MSFSRNLAVRRLRSACCIPFLLLSGLCSVASPPNAWAQIVRPIDPHAASIAEASHRFDIPAAWIRAVMHVESRGQERAISPAGAMGLMQIMPDTWADLRFRHALGFDPFDPHDNILAGAAYLREMHDLFGSPGFLAAYNAGPKRYADHLSNGRALPAETLDYVAILTPMVTDSTILKTLPIQQSLPIAWKIAPLFVTRVEQDDGAQAAASVRDLSAIAPHSSGLFIPRSGAGKAP